MTDTTTPVTIPSFAATLIHSYAQKLVTSLATLAVTAGLLDPKDLNQTETVGVGIVVGIVSIIWTLVRDKLQNDKLKQVAAGAPVVAPK